METRHIIICDGHMILYRDYVIEVGIDDYCGANAVFTIRRASLRPDDLENKSFQTLQQALEAIDKASDA